MRGLISAGGTGGGIFPALAVVQALLRSDPEAQILWVGGEGGMEGDIVPRYHIAYQSIPAAGLHGVGLSRILPNGLTLARGFLRSVATVRAFRPDALLVTGGYVAIPTALASWANRVPILAYLPDLRPALAIRFVARLARRVAISAAESRAWFPRSTDTVVTGYPLRQELMVANREEARRHFRIDAQAFVLLVLGGSRGARAINRAVETGLADLLEQLEVIHITGSSDWEEVHQVVSNLPPALREKHHAFPFLYEEMGLALAAGDLAVSRAGASVLGEYPHFQLPSILVPYPHAGRYQEGNADYLVRVGAAIKLADADLGTKLKATVLELEEDRDRLAQMRRALRSIRIEDGSSRLAQEFVRLARESGQSG
ncbi:MAG: UDP-N-acetylglucosamine--N-acetylmuramyl-(pentapeptide) pyrophosphoryl-undecaprenol N-acetylglucosamine transferase [Anaerolineales bacterium]|jgi:UDP-N-acetylglucosamine--N-acetylmuramyl-(pentapeptide) pyrophosphoryl-undecaprenol N-acetylglucosamine transferase